MRDAALSAMPALKVLAACSSVTAGAAAVCCVAYLQSDSLAFTTPNVREVAVRGARRTADHPNQGVFTVINRVMWLIFGGLSGWLEVTCAA